MEGTPPKYYDRLSSPNYSPKEREEESTFVSPMEGAPQKYYDRLSSPIYSPVHQYISYPYSPYSHYSPRPLSMPKIPRIEIDMKLATHILLDEVRKGSSGKNVVCSPLSLEFALQTVAAGSKGETLSQIMQFIGFKGNQLDSMEDLNLKSSRIMRVASSYEPKKEEEEEEEEEPYKGPYASCVIMERYEKEPELSFVNGVWVDKFYPLKPSYKELMTSIYNAKAETVEFKKQAGQLTGDINSWVADKTKGLIKQIVAPGSISGDTILILVNALYFKGLWNSKSKFREDMTEDRDFYMLDGSKISVPFMTRPFPNNLYRAFDGFSILQLDYQSGDDEQRQFCMQILLPDERDGLQNLMNKCVSDRGFLNQDFGLKYEKFKELRIPKFKFTYMIDNLVGMMRSLGLTLPFDSECKDLTEMVELPDGGNLRISNILHKAIIEVNESRTEAAAVTYMSSSPGCAPCTPPPPPTLRFVADHPFMFVIKEVYTGAIFFIGAVFNPLKEE